MARIVLVGLPGAGKSSVARALARRWGCAAVDTDDLVAARAGRPTGEYLRVAGEERFRDEEAEALRISLEGDGVVATGAGVVERVASRELLAEEFTVWLDADDATLSARVAQGDRPLLGPDALAGIARLRAVRGALYAEVARARVDASGDLESVCARVVEAVGP